MKVFCNNSHSTAHLLIYLPPLASFVGIFHLYSDCFSPSLPPDLGPFSPESSPGDELRPFPSDTAAGPAPAVRAETKYIGWFLNANILQEPNDYCLIN